MGTASVGRRSSSGTILSDRQHTRPRFRALRRTARLVPVTVRDPTREVRVAPNIYKTPYGWRVYVRRRDPATGKSAKHPVRFKPDVTLEELEHFRDSYKLESKRLRREAKKAGHERAIAGNGMFPRDAAAYLELETVKAMPSYKDRVRDIHLWVAAFGNVPRKAITSLKINQQLQRWINEGYAASTVNGRRTALMAMFTDLDGRAAANPVREARVFEEPELEARGLPYSFIYKILDAIPDARSYSHKRATKVHPLKTKPRIGLEAVTGMYPSQIGLIKKRRHFSVAERWYVIPRRKKGLQRRQPRAPRPMTRKHMTDEQAYWFQRFDELDCYGKYSASSRRRIFNAGVRVAEQEIQQELKDPEFRFPADLVPRDLRHSFGTEVLRQTKNLETTAELLDQTTTRMTKRYALGAIPDVLKAAAIAFEEGTKRSRKRRAPITKRPRAPKRRRPALVPVREVPGSL